MKRVRQKRRKLYAICCAVSCALAITVSIFIAVNISRSFIAYGEKTDSTDYRAAEGSIGSGSHIINIEGLSQEGIPTGCEAVSTVALLNHYGINITVHGFIENYLPKEDFYNKNGKIYGADPSLSFAGDPYEKSSLGCYCEAIEGAVKNMVRDNYKGTSDLRAEGIRGSSLSYLVLNYIQKDKPVIIWATSDMKKSGEGFTYYLETGEKYVWKSGEHCLVLCGYDESHYLLMDPQKNGDIVRYEKSLVEKRYEEMGKQAVIIEKN